MSSSELVWNEVTNIQTSFTDAQMTLDTGCIKYCMLILSWIVVGVAWSCLRLLALKMTLVLTGFKPYSPHQRRRCHRFQTRAGSGSPPEPSMETCPPKTCVLCASETLMPRNHRSAASITEWSQMAKDTEMVCSPNHLKLLSVTMATPGCR